MADQLVTSLRASLAETWAFYFKAHSFHWNVRGPLFSELHEFFGDIYADAHEAVDGLAEKIRTLDENAPVSLDEIVKPSSIKFSGAIPDAGGMVYQLLQDNDKVIASLLDTNKLAVAANKQGLANYLQGRIDQHDKWHWMIKAHLDQKA
jgi:starvation-inducible DNA-binding protein